MSVYLNHSIDSTKSLKKSSTAYCHISIICIIGRNILTLPFRAKLDLLRHKYPWLFWDNNNIKWNYLKSIKVFSYLEYLGQVSWEHMVIRVVLWLNSSTRIWREIAYTACKDGAFVKIYMLTDAYHLLLRACINYFSLQWNTFSLLNCWDFIFMPSHNLVLTFFIWQKVHKGGENCWSSVCGHGKIQFRQWETQK